MNSMPDSMEHGKLYLIERADKGADFRYYAEHGEMGGAHARTAADLVVLRPNT